MLANWQSQWVQIARNSIGTNVQSRRLLVDAPRPRIIEEYQGSWSNPSLVTKVVSGQRRNSKPFPQERESCQGCGQRAQPRGSRSFNKKSSFGSCVGSSTLLLLPLWGTQVIAYSHQSATHKMACTSIVYLYFLNLLIIWRWCTIQISCYLCTQIRSSDERAKDILRQYKGVRCCIIFYVVIWYVDVLQT